MPPKTYWPESKKDLQFQKEALIKVLDTYIIKEIETKNTQPELVEKAS